MRSEKRFLLAILSLLCIFSLCNISAKAENYTQISGGSSAQNAVVMPFDGTDYVTTVTNDQKIYFKFNVPAGTRRFYEFYTKNLSMTDSYKMFIYSGSILQIKSKVTAYEKSNKNY